MFSTNKIDLDYIGSEDLDGTVRMQLQQQFYHIATMQLPKSQSALYLTDDVVAISFTSYNY